MTQPSCECGHEKRDHRPGLLGNGGTQYGECKVCLCRAYQKRGEQELTQTGSVNTPAN